MSTLGAGSAGNMKTKVPVINGYSLTEGYENIPLS